MSARGTGASFSKNVRRIRTVSVFSWNSPKIFAVRFPSPRADTWVRPYGRLGRLFASPKVRRMLFLVRRGLSLCPPAVQGRNCKNVRRIRTISVFARNSPKNFAVRLPFLRADTRVRPYEQSGSLSHKFAPPSFPQPAKAVGMSAPTNGREAFRFNSCHPPCPR